MRSLVILFALAGCANWTHKDTAVEAAFLTVTAIDWDQTQMITHACGELNPVIGSCGNGVPVNVYFPLVMVAHVAIAALLPPGWWRGTFQGVTLGVEATTTYWNHRSHEIR